MSPIRVKLSPTEFAPESSFWLTNWTDLVRVDAIPKWIIDNEQKI